MTNSDPQKYNPIIFGEVLFDCFDDGAQVLGGAPFNVARNLAAFGNRPFLISSVGSDDLGKTILAKMTSWDMATDGIGVTDRASTGKVTITVTKGQPTFSILKNQAYDYIMVPDAVTQMQASKDTFLYFGTLALRSKHNQNSLNKIITTLNPTVFVDINLRMPWWDMLTVNIALSKAHWLKINDDELTTLSNKLGYKENDLKEIARIFLNQYKFNGIIVTCGEKGAFVLTPNYYGKPPAPKQKEVIDTVGAGDAFAAVFLHGLIHQWNIETTTNRAQDFASRICELRGAVSEDKSFYTNLLEKW
ncbi:carbohydrate kinase [bacterium]|nr:carbohydrate kinase [bacterium]